MSLEHEIEDVRTKIQAGRYENEAAVSQGVVRRLLRALGWDTDDPWMVFPEYPLEGRRVDFALCHPPRKPKAFVEVKKLGQSNGAERQLFEYAFLQGVQLVILTTGQEWSFFLPAEEGDYGERCVYKLDIIERGTDECVLRLDRYLKYEAVISGTAIQAAREEYRNVSQERQIKATLPQVWAQLISGKDESLLKLLAERVASLCGHTPDLDAVASFLKVNAISTPQTPAIPIRSSPRVPAPALVSPRPSQSSAAYGFVLDERHYEARNGIDVLVKVFEELTKRDPSFPARFASLPKHGQKRRYLARTPDELYPDRPDLVLNHSKQLSFDWWIGTNYDNNQKIRIIKLACKKADLRYGKDLRVEMGK